MCSGRGSCLDLGFRAASLGRRILEVKVRFRV